jgi:hypothetical protein
MKKKKKTKKKEEVKDEDEKKNCFCAVLISKPLLLRKCHSTDNCLPFDDFSLIVRWARRAHHWSVSRFGRFNPS